VYFYIGTCSSIHTKFIAVSTATMVTRMRHNVTLYVHCLCYSILVWSFKLLPNNHKETSVVYSMLSHSPLHCMLSNN